MGLISWLTNAALAVIVFAVLTWMWVMVNWIWLKPKKLEKCLRQQGLQGNRYSLLFTDMRENRNKLMKVNSKPIGLSDDILPRVVPHVFQTIQKYGRNSFTWLGPIPSVIVTDPVLIKEILMKIYDFQRPDTHTITKILATGIFNTEGKEWVHRRKIINPAFHMEKLKLMLSKFHESTLEMISSWEGMMSAERSYELDVVPYLKSMTADVISRTAFGSSYKEGRRIFELLHEMGELTVKASQFAHIPGQRFVPTRTDRKLKEIDKQVKSSLKTIINQREKAMKAGTPTPDDLLGILLQSNRNEMREHGNQKGYEMSVEDVIEECKLFYLAGQETTSVLLTWTMVLLSRYPDWQAQARKEVLQVFGNKKPNFDGLSHLKIVPMILYEVLRLYSPVIAMNKRVPKDIKLGNRTIPAGVQIHIPVLLIHHDRELWGDDVLEFNPARFSEGISKATKGSKSFFPFGGGPRICIGQNFAMLEAKMALTLILQHFSFEFSILFSCPHSFSNTCTSTWRSYPVAETKMYFSRRNTNDLILSVDKQSKIIIEIMESI